MSTEWGFYFNPDRCMGCHACAIACKNRHGVEEAGVDWRRVEHTQTGEFPNVSELNVSISCMHCGDSPCETVCPAGAIEKRDSDGIVTVDRDACIGCKYCGWACSYGAPQYGSDGKMQKCNLCLDRGAGSGAGATAKQDQDEPLTPACVDECVGGALHAGPIEEMMDKASQEAAMSFRQSGEGANVIIESQADVPVDVDPSEGQSAD